MKTNSTAYLQALLDIIPVAVTGVDTNGVVVSWNRAATDLYGIPLAEIHGQPLRNFFPEESLVILNVLTTEEEVFQSYHRPRGDRHVLINAKAIYLNDQIIGAIASEQDITQLVNLHDDLAIANYNLQRLEKAVNQDAQQGAFALIHGKSTVIREAIQMAQKVALTDATVLLTGESGVGKELFARAIHTASSRRQGPFIALNCGAIPAALFESELFGYERGAFTGAERKGSPGKLTLAQGGTLFLDEIGDLPLDLQVKLLRVLQEQTYYRLGGSTPLKVEARILAATNRSLEKMVEEGSFRKDLYFRLNVISLEIPPLRQRIEDIPDLVDYFIQQFAIQYGKPAPRISPDAIQLLMQYSWPGNLRELRNIIERVVILNEGGLIHPEDLRLSFPLPPVATHKPWGIDYTFRQQIHHTLVNSEIEKQQLLGALNQANGNKSTAARLLGISRATLYNRLQRYFPNSPS